MFELVPYSRKRNLTFYNPFDELEEAGNSAHFAETGDCLKNGEKQEIPPKSERAARNGGPFVYTGIRIDSSSGLRN